MSENQKNQNQYFRRNMEYKEINLEQIRNSAGEAGILFIDKDGKPKLGKIVFPNENEKDKRIFFQ